MISNIEHLLNETIQRLREMGQRIGPDEISKLVVMQAQDLSVPLESINEFLAKNGLPPAPSGIWKGIVGLFAISAFVTDASGLKVNRLSLNTIGPKLVIEVENISTIPRAFEVTIRAERGLLSFEGNNAWTHSVPVINCAMTSTFKVGLTLLGKSPGAEVLISTFRERRGNLPWSQLRSHVFSMSIDIV